MIEKISFIGAGSMAEAIVEGIVTEHVIESNRVYVSNKRNKVRLRELERKYNVIGTTDKREVIENSTVIVLATKPNDVENALLDIKPFINENQLIVSVIAGISTSLIRSIIGKKVPVIRTMPNTSASIGYSATAIAKGEYATESDLKIVQHLFNAIGTVSVVDEEQMHIVTAISGSGPAYIYYLVEAMEQIAKEEGLDEETAKQLITQTIIGAGKMLTKSNESAKTLRENVTSPNGTTAAGIQILKEYHFQEAIINCIKSAKERSVQLGEEQ